jgi:hypothetical protein
MPTHAIIRHDAAISLSSSTTDENNRGIRKQAREVVMDGGPVSSKGTN